MMIKRVRTFAYYSIFWLAYFMLARIFFLLIQYKETFTYKPAVILGTISNGFIMDIWLTASIIFIPLLLAIPETFYRNIWYKRLFKYYNYIILIIASGIIVTDAKLYSYWGFRMDSTLLYYLNTPGDAMASIDTGLTIYFLICFIIIISASVFTLNRLILNNLELSKRVDNKHNNIVSVIILTIVLIIPVISSTGGRRMNGSAVYFSENLFPNHAAINVVWNTGGSLLEMNPESNPYSYLDKDEAKNIISGLTSYSDEQDTVIRHERPNILLIILESFGSAMTGVQENEPEITPRFNSLIKDGVYFNNFFAVGSRTDKALPAIFSGYPSPPVSPIVKYPRKTQSLPGFVRLLGAKGYNTKFWYGGDLDFANLESYIKNTGFDQIISRENFGKGDQKSKWGVHDEVLFKLLSDSLNNAREPFCYAVLTLSSHEPFDVPMKSEFNGSSVTERFKNSIFYTDSVLGAFIGRSVNAEWWKNSVIIIMADHCRRNSDTTPLYSEEIFRIPMLWMGGALAKKGITISKYGSQTDFPVTLSSQLGLKENYAFGKNILSENSRSFAFYTFNEGFVFITDTSTVTYDHNGGRAFFRRGNNPDLTEKYGKAYLQLLYDDYIRR